MQKEIYYDEMLSNIYADYYEWQKFMNSIGKKVKNRIAKSSIFPVSIGPFEFNTKSNRKYLIYISGYSKKDCNAPYVGVVNYDQTNFGYRANAIFVAPNGINVMSYLENVFKSYKDYYYEDSASDLEVLKGFFKTNTANISKDIDNKLIFQCEDGLLTGFNLNEKIIVIHSFTPNDLIYNEQMD